MRAAGLDRGRGDDEAGEAGDVIGHAEEGPFDLPFDHSAPTERLRDVSVDARGGGGQVLTEPLEPVPRVVRRCAQREEPRAQAVGVPGVSLRGYLTCDAELDDIAGFGAAGALTGSVHA